MIKKGYKIDLTLADDVKKGVQSYFSITSTGLSKAQAAINALREALSIHDKAISEAKNFQSLKAKIEQSAKDLGVMPNQWEIYTDLNTAISDVKIMEQNATALQKAINLLS
jgi:hypothetical protein